jgi:hypothetical protein
MPRILYGPNEVGGTIYIPEFSGLTDTLKITYNTRTLVDPDILSGTVEYQNKIHQCFANKLYAEGGFLYFMMIYVPRKEYTTVLTVDWHPSTKDILVLNGTKLTIESVVVDGEPTKDHRYRRSNAKITLFLSKEAVEYLQTEIPQLRPSAAINGRTPSILHR